LSSFSDRGLAGRYPLIAQTAPKKALASPPADASAAIGGKTISIHLQLAAA